MNPAHGYRQRLTPFADALRRLHDLLLRGERADADLLEALTALYLEGQRLNGMAGDFRGELDIADYKVPDGRGHLRPKVISVTGPLQYYACFFAPVADLFNAKDPVVGDLLDDLLDICGDLLPGLRAFDSGRDELLGGCHFAWSSLPGFWHWGQHALGAMTALHGQLHVSTPEPIEDRAED